MEWAGNEVREVDRMGGGGGRGGEGKFLGRGRGRKNPGGGEGGGFSVHPQNGLNGLILNWCTGG